MLQHSTIEPATLALLKQLMQIDELKTFSLVGGTALALKHGHRISVDLDLFSSNDFDNEKIISVLELHFPGFTYKANPTIGIFGFIDEVKVDIVKYHHYPLIDEITEEEGIRMVSDKDILAMKINAILRRGVKKDFWDIAELLNYYTVQQSIDFYKKKYHSQQLPIAIPQALIYFEDAEESELPNSLKGQTWKMIKHQITLKVSEYLS